MPRERFDQLRERLLRAGVAPRHVKRYVTELRDHLDDVVREEIEKGMNQSAAEDMARARIGSDDQLSAVMLARPDLRSITSRFPWAVFGVGPVLMLVIVIVAAVLIEGLFLYSHRELVRLWGEELPATPPDWIKLLVFAWNCVITYAVPLMIAAMLCILGVRQRMSGYWIMLGAAVVCIVGAFHLVDATWGDLSLLSASDPVADRPQIGVTLALAPPFPQWLINEGLLRAAINLALVGSGYWLWLRREPHRTSQSP